MATGFVVVVGVTVIADPVGVVKIDELMLRSALTPKYRVEGFDMGTAGRRARAVNFRPESGGTPR